MSTKVNIKHSHSSFHTAIAHHCLFFSLFRSEFNIILFFTISVRTRNMVETWVLFSSKNRVVVVVVCAENLWLGWDDRKRKAYFFLKKPILADNRIRLAQLTTFTIYSQDGTFKIPWHSTRFLHTVLHALRVHTCTQFDAANEIKTR